MAAIALSATHSTLKGSGSRGLPVVQGANYGNVFPVALTFMGLLGWRLSSAGVPLTVTLSYWVAVPCLIVDVMFVAGAAMWNGRSQLAFGARTLVVGHASVALPSPHNLVGDLVGGIGFLVLAIIQSTRPSLTSGP